MVEEIVKRRFPFFESELRSAISEAGTFKEFKAQEELIREDQFIRSFPIVLSGLIKVCRTDEEGKELLLYYLRPGEVCTVSLICCMDRTRSRVKAIAEEKTTAIVVPVELLDSWMTMYQTWKEYVMHSMQMRFDELLNTLDSIAFLKMDERLEKFFTERYRSSGSKIFDGSHQDVAMAMNSSREVISRLLKQMENKGLIHLSRGQIDYSPLCDKSY
ncbi:MAG: Crp/Fnr family transcriptional regulator [Bacteroidetes bacterium]|nr:MAG: Crp/Fnr family transcriptional regulator [Bacteroidota bacterium]RLD71660.1 MAG: Crp/Fnr family transcriptional regulator [Bacteroidota bacterium]RLD93197.1 MAG: Crp/Fnr family transcriptional regulator [Bacteroidota bacterium]